MENIVKLTNLTKSFSSKKAVDNVDMNIYKGDIYGFITAETVQEKQL